jgi:hypothetical protein
MIGVWAWTVASRPGGQDPLLRGELSLPAGL